MQSKFSAIAVIMAGLILVGVCAEVRAGDYDPRFTRHYPPGYYGMWYYADRFYDMKRDAEGRVIEPYRWDRYMSRVTGVQHPFYPIPFGWEYGTGRRFGLPDYTKNPWN